MQIALLQDGQHDPITASLGPDPIHPVPPLPLVPVHTVLVRHTVHVHCVRWFAYKHVRSMRKMHAHVD